MNDLQWALILLGVLIVVGVYLFSRMQYRRNRAADEQGPSATDERNPWDELLSDDGLEERDAFAPRDTEKDQTTQACPDDPGEEAPPEEVAEPAGCETPAAEETPRRSRADVPNIRMRTPTEGDEKLIVLHVASSSWLDGEQVHAALEACKLHFGPRHIYHRIEEVDGVPESVFSVANMLKPGYLDPAESEQLRTRGLSLFMVLPGPVSGARAYRDLLETAGELAERLGGDVLDDRKTPLNKQMAQYLHEEVVEFERRRRAARA